jgi:iron complex transport system ATP-binding protein
VPAERGDVLLDGRPIGTLPVAERARAIGFMPQRFEPHWDLTPQELLGLRPAQVPADEVLAREGLGALRDRRWSTLSGGEQARVLLAMVLAPDPPILLADEPGASLDVRHRLALVEALAERGRTRLVVVAMHDLDLAFAHFKHIVVVAEGAIAATGGAELAHAPLLDRVFGVRFERIGTAPDLVLRARRAAEQGAA